MMRKFQRAGLDAYEIPNTMMKWTLSFHYHLADGAIAFVNLKKWVSSEWRSHIFEAGIEVFGLVAGEWLIS